MQKEKHHDLRQELTRMVINATYICKASIYKPFELFFSILFQLADIQWFLIIDPLFFVFTFGNSSTTTTKSSKAIYYIHYLCYVWVFNYCFYVFCPLCTFGRHLLVWIWLHSVKKEFIIMNVTLYYLTVLPLTTTYS